MPAPKISVVVPVYNEQEAIEETIVSIKNTFKDLASEIIIVNDGSTDKSSRILKHIHGITVITHPYNLGYGASLKNAIRQASGQWIVITDADGTYPIKEIPKLLRFIPDYDMVVGARTGKIVHVPFFRRPAKWFIGKLANIVTGKKIDDINSGLRVFNREKALEFLKLYPSGFSFTTTITLAFLTNDYTIKYVPINYYKRKGKSTIRPFRDFIGFTTLIFRIVIFFKPAKFFLIPGIILVLLGIGFGAYQIFILSVGLGDFPPLAIIVGLMTVMMGFLAEMISKK